MRSSTPFPGRRDRHGPSSTLYTLQPQESGRLSLRLRVHVIQEVTVATPVATKQHHNYSFFIYLRVDPRGDYTSNVQEKCRGPWDQRRVYSFYTWNPSDLTDSTGSYSLALIHTHAGHYLTRDSVKGGTRDSATLSKVGGLWDLTLLTHLLIRLNKNTQKKFTYIMYWV